MTVIRYDQADLSSRDRAAFVDAVLTLKRVRRAGNSISIYDEFVRTHDRYFRGVDGAVATHAHGSWSFLPWHRQFLLDFEKALQTIDPDVSVPWWNWLRDGDAGADVFDDAFLGPADDRTPNDSVFFSTATWPMVVRGQLGSATLRRRLRPGLIPRSIQRPASFADFTDRLEDGPHNRVHDALAGHMGSGVSPNDPLFWLHHCFLDRVWSQWQERYGVRTYPERTQGRHTGRNGRIGPWPIRPNDVLDHRRWYRYAD
ncbi:tyrosinase [Pilimelia anulata]|uniref:Tyrosinase n=1 Tax=Pilimelia anulata TaxID=53371 RepID=A0A8J3BBZ6_9ACTN|nr:tyrosinase family protein [Pilimelia anulata]GGJ95657.1 tyrosinase [Pilimelia anulata]